MRERIGNRKLFVPERTGTGKKNENAGQNGYMEYLQGVSEATGLPIRRLIDLYHPGCVRVGEDMYAFWG